MLRVYILEDELNIVKYIWSILDQIPRPVLLSHNKYMSPD